MPEDTQEVKALKKITDLERDLKNKEGILERTKNLGKAQKKDVDLATRKLHHAIQHANQPDLEFKLDEPKKKKEKKAGRPKGKK